MALYFREALRQRRHRRIRKKVLGTAQRPRLAVYRSNLHLYVQLIDDREGKTLLNCSTLQPALRKKIGKGKGGDLKAAQQLGEAVAISAKAAGITKAVFDRGGYHYHGRVKALAEAARAKGLEI